MSSRTRTEKVHCSNMNSPFDQRTLQGCRTLSELVLQPLYYNFISSPSYRERESKVDTVCLFLFDYSFFLIIFMDKIIMDIKHNRLILVYRVIFVDETMVTLLQVRGPVTSVSWTGRESLRQDHLRLLELDQVSN